MGESIRKAFKYRLQPNRDQRLALDRTLGLCRDLYNCALEQRRGQRIGQFEQMRQLTDLRKDAEEYRTVHVHVLQNVLRKLNSSFNNFFARRLAGGRAGFPRFKGADRYSSFAFNNVGFALQGNRLWLSKIGSIKMRLSRPVIGDIKTCTVVRRNAKWYVCFSVVCEAKQLPSPGTAVGIDVGIENYAALSNGDLIPNPRFYETAQRALRTIQRRIARRERKGRRRRKAVAALRELHERVANRRLDFIHKQTTDLVRRYGLIAVENLNIEVLAQGILSKQVHDASWAMFFRLLSYKAAEAGRELVEVDARYTSQTCPACGKRKRKSLSEREHRCECGYIAHRDVAAALVILGRAGPLNVNVGEVIPCVV
jgi:putative transposase